MTGRSLLFIHQNFPSVLFSLAKHYAADPENTVVAVGEAENLHRSSRIAGVTLLG